MFFFRRQLVGLDGSCCHNSQRKRYRVTLKASLKTCDLDPDNFLSGDSQQAFLAKKCYRAIHDFETHRIERLQEKWKYRKQATTTLYTTPVGFLCDT